ncbi:unnamed protein product [Rhizophagus irregularis]|uniref:Uncharacterized protein n=1 Tax=Rhizophagus irregularis TaxID=588596 RepID=A0A916E0X4_9GLOM|nr:unnamed protein product [Rhizophagus irregularis]CAB5346557.1 unnamed protein product [Rhizophagus irregularis]
MHEYNESFREGDLVLFGGKFTIDDQKLLVVIEMANVIEPKLGRDNEPLEWDPLKIPATKPFIRIATSAYEPVTIFNNMKFVKTRSLIYTPFHKEARYINFEVGYPKDAKWFDYLNDKWASYANFFVAGFFEGMYSTIENASTATYAQIDAKIIDYDARFRHPSSDNRPSSSPVASPSTNIFAQRRNRFSSESSITKNDSIITIEDTQNESDTEEDPISIVNDKSPKKKRQLSDLCLTDDESDLSASKPIEENQPYSEKGGSGKREGRGKRGGRAKK